MKSRKLIVAAVITFFFFPFMFTGGLVGLGLLGGGDSASAACPDDGAVVGGPPSKVAQDSIPSNLIPIYHAAEKEYHVPWNLLAAINRIETDFGRNMNTSSAGAIGWMQFIPSTWAAYGVDANHDGHKDPYDPEDAIFSAANYLHASGAPKDIRGAIFAYNHADWYVNDVLQYMAKYALAPLGDPVDLGGSCESALTGIPGKVIIAPGANKPGQPITKVTLAFVAKVSGLYEHPLVVTIGTNHDYLTVDGNVSDHASGHAVDIGMNANGGTDDGPVGDAIMTACLRAAGDPPDVAGVIARLREGPVQTRIHDHLRIQCIWGTYAGGNHHNHDHIGARPA